MRTKRFTFIMFQRHYKSGLLILSAILTTSVVLDILHTNLFSANGRNSTRSQRNNHHATIGKVTMLYGDTNTVYERALQGQIRHNEVHSYPMFTLREKTLPGYWSKPAHILEIILAELAKPEADRLEWLFWVDADIVMMNPYIPLEIFLPPPTFKHLNLLTTNDHRGLNNGAFFIRIHSWSANLFAAILSLPTFDPSIPLKFADQSAMSHILITYPQYKNATMYVPQRWFNAYAGYRGKDDHDPWSKPKKYSHNAVLEGDLQVHMAGGKKNRVKNMTPFLDASEMRSKIWEMPLAETGYLKEINRFWEKESKGLK